MHGVLSIPPAAPLPATWSLPLRAGPNHVEAAGHELWTRFMRPLGYVELLGHHGANAAPAVAVPSVPEQPETRADHLAVVADHVIGAVGSAVAATARSSRVVFYDTRRQRTAVALSALAAALLAWYWGALAGVAPAVLEELAR